MDNSNRDRFPVLVHVILRNAAGDVYLLKRAAHLEYGGLYCLPGGHMQRGEGLLDAARRECFEEVGVTLEHARLHKLLTYRTSNPDAMAGQGLNAIFVGQISTAGPAPRMNEPQHFDWGGFCSPLKLPDTCVPWLRDALNEAESSATALIEYVWD